MFTSESRNDMSGNFKYIYDEMLNLGLQDKYKIYGVFKGHILNRYKLVDKFKLPYLLGKADYIFIDDFHPTINKVEFRNSQEIIQLWHAVGTLKTFGYSRIGKKDGPFFDSYGHKKYTKAFVSSPKDIPIYAEAFGIKEDNVIPTGIPRTDAFFDEDYKEKVIRKMENIIPEINGKKVLLFAPTFRGSGHETAYYPFNNLNFEKLHKYCQSHDAIILIKLHPFVKNKLIIPDDYHDSIVNISDIREINDVLFITDLLITDYSSVIFEFALLKRPMLFFAFDLEDYILTRDFYVNYKDFVPGKIVRTFDQLINALNNEDYEEEKINKFVENHFKYKDSQSSRRVINCLFK